MEPCALLAEYSAPVIPPLLDLLRSRGMACLALADSGSSAPPDESALQWNAPSLLSAHTAILEARTRHGGLSVAVFAFDADAFAPSVPYGGAGDVAGAVDRLVSGWMYLVESAREQFRKQGDGFFCFVHAVPSPKSETARPLPPLPVSVAEAAFVRLAEETAARDRDGAKALLVRYENGGDPGQLEWLASRVLEGPPARPQARWVKAGAKGLFGLL